MSVLPQGGYGMSLDVCDDGLRKLDPIMKVGCGRVKALGEGHVLENGL
jgi:hypothetical protein